MNDRRLSANSFITIKYEIKTINKQIIMSEIERDQEKLLNASAQVVQNVVSAAANLSTLYKPKTKVQIKTAKDDVQQAQQSLKSGTDLKDVKQSLTNSQIGIASASAGGNPEKYADLVIRKAQINNAIEHNDNQVKVKKIKKKL